ncbi:unnamed protein product [Euphydryas editha]|uniref:Uncharacterized protein n=1 Tax=Euphydryas editha TaxID=104508 RepID=A0AAU9VB32_EUPED|nr:unnamed protein product [Euphydryas editha]
MSEGDWKHILINFQEPRVNVWQHNVAVEESILQAFDEDLTTNIQLVAERLDLSVWKVWSVLRQNGKHVHHYTPVQGLIDDDHRRRLDFCRFMMHTDVEDSNFLKRILCTDKSNFNHE